MTDEPDCFDRFVLHDTDGEKVLVHNAIPPFDQPPGIAIVGDRYFVLYEDGTYHESEIVHWLPTPKEWKHAVARTDRSRSRK